MRVYFKCLAVLAAITILYLSHLLYQNVVVVRGAVENMTSGSSLKETFVDTNVIPLPNKVLQNGTIVINGTISKSLSKVFGKETMLTNCKVIQNTKAGPETMETAQNNNTERIHVILSFRIISKQERENAHARMMEYVECLKRFICNPNVKQVHLMYSDSSDMTGFIQENVGHHPKLLLHKVQSPDVVLTLHEFAFTHLQGEVVVITQADIILGEGFEKVSKQLLLEKRLMYSLSRHEDKCFRRPDYCKNYVGSHDMFVFVPMGNITEQGKRLLSHFVYNQGTENVVMYVYRNLLRYRILNPCRIIKIYHHHCSGVRKYTTKQIRVNLKTSAIAMPVSSLV